MEIEKICYLTFIKNSTFAIYMLTDRNYQNITSVLFVFSVILSPREMTYGLFQINSPQLRY